MTLETDGALFEERAENLSDEQFIAWTARSPHEGEILRQLTSGGPRLLSGPRGCGKSTLLLMAQQQIGSRGRALPVYVNYGRSMFIEPAFAQRSDADGFFQDWLAAKLIVEAVKALKRLMPDTSIVPEDLAARAAAFVDSAEVDTTATRVALPGPNALAARLEEWAAVAGRGNVILLLDDAAHAFVPEQQRIFFEFLRNIRTPTVTFKAAIYPGVTEFSPNFHVGHDAKVTRAWVSSDSSEYLAFMKVVYERRLPAELRATIPNEVVDFFAGTAFGVPRLFFSMLEMYLDTRRADTGRSARVPLTVISEHADQLRVLHRSLAKKLPRYQEYVSAGEIVLDRALQEMGELNADRFRRGQNDSAVVLAIRQPIDSQLNTILGLLEYGGLIRRTNESVSLGKDGTYTKFAVHGCLLVSSNTLKYGQNPSLQQRADSLIRAGRTGSFKRTRSDSLLDPELADRCQLVVGACQNCGTPRASEASRFCSNCGHELVDSSRLDELLAAPVNALPLTARKIKALSDAGLLTVEALVRDRGLAEIGKARRVGPVWARRIYSLAEEYVGV